MARMKKLNNYAFGKLTASLETSIDVLFERVRCTLKKPVVTYEELLRLIAPEDHIDVLMRARQIGDIGSYVGNETTDRLICRHRGTNIGVRFEVNGPNAPIIPRRCLWLDHFPCNRDLVAALVASAKEHADVSIDWGYVKMVFKYLNQECDTPQQLRYIWPSVLGLMSLNDDLGVVRQELMHNVVPRKLPTLLPEVRALCKTTAATVTMALMLPPLESEPHSIPDVEIKFIADTGGQRKATKPDGDGVWFYPLN